MLSLGPGYVRLDLVHDTDFVHVSESIRALLHVCRMNGLNAALIASRQDAFDWRSSLRIGLRFAAARGSIAGARLALVTHHFNDGARADVLAVAGQLGLECQVFHGDAEAIAWLSTGSATPAPGGPRL